MLLWNLTLPQISLIILILLTILPKATPIFCSAYCRPNSCTGPSASECTACDQPFTYKSSNNTCQIDANSQYVYFAGQSQIMNMQGGSANCGGYTFNGQYNFNDQITLRLDNPITIPHYSVRVIAWVIMYNEWNLASDYFLGQLNTSAQTVRQNVTTYSTAELLCSWSTSNQWYMKLDMEFLHSDLDRVKFMLSTTDVQQEPWGIKEYMFLLGRCHVACRACLDGTVNNCTACASGYKLSGTVCNQSCLYKYGATSNASICIACDPYCTACYMVSTNCSACQTNGTYQSFLNWTSCVTTCPIGYTKRTSNHRCIPCTSNLCDICTTDAPSTCTQCATGAFWFNFTCLASCPLGYYPTAPNCTQCHVSCDRCTGVPTPCTACANGYFLYTTSCLTVCPSGFFAFRPARQCLDCPTYCVTASISTSISSDNRKLISVITFSRRIDFANFPYSTFHTITTNDSTLDISAKFVTTYTPISDYSYQIQLIPKPTINMSNTIFTISISSKTQQFYSSDGYLFNDNIYLLTDFQPWTLIVYPEMTGNQQAIVAKFEAFNEGVNQGLGGQFVQEIKKTGVFGFLFPGAQLCSTVVLHNSVPAQNMYQGARFWANFIYFEVPKWEQGPNLTKYLVKPAVSEFTSPSSLSSASSSISSSYHNFTARQNRFLQTTTIQNWRFLRTGHTEFFIFDTYFILGLLIVSWLLLLIPRVRGRKMTPNTRSIFFNILHKVHQLSLFYITMSVILEWISLSTKMSSAQFPSNYAYVYASFGVSLAATLYYLIYQVYVFYKLIPFGHVKAGSAKYLNYIEKYSYFLRDIRYEEYRRDMAWTPRHMLRPYNYQILSCIRLILLVSALPIFHQYPSASIACMLIIQILQLLRFIFTWPYHQTCRNITKLLLQFFLLTIFTIFLVLYIMITYIYQNLNIITDNYLRVYYLLGWIGMVMIFLYNVLFIGMQGWELVRGFRYGNQERVDESRKEYYYQVLGEFQDTALAKLGYAEGRRTGKIQDKLDLYGEIDYRNIEAVNRMYGNNKDVIAKQRKQKEVKQEQKQKQSILNRQIWRRLRHQLSIDPQKINAEYQQQVQYQQQLQKLQLQKGSTFLQFLTILHGGENVLYYPKNNGVGNRRKAVQEIIRNGNLNGECYGEFGKVRVKIEEFQVRYTERERKYQVKIYKVPALFMRQEIDPDNSPTDNILIPNKNIKQISLISSQNPEYFIIIDTLFHNYASISTEYVKIRTFLTVDQGLYNPGQEIMQSMENLTQWIEVKEYNGSVEKEMLVQLLPMFPVPYQLVEKL